MQKVIEVTTAIDQHFCHQLSHLYISPLESCNLHCQMCYTRKTTARLTPPEILDFVARYRQALTNYGQKHAQPAALQSVTFCGGEVFLLSDFVAVVNVLTAPSSAATAPTALTAPEKNEPGLLVQIITNGTLDRLAEIKQPNSVNLIVSLDGLPEYHDQNRGAGNFARSLAFLKKAQRLGFHLAVFCVVTRQNFPQLGQFEALLRRELGELPDITYHPRKPLAYLQQHPVANVLGQVAGFDFITAEQRAELAQQRAIFPPPGLGCYQVSLMSDRQIYSCCEGIKPLGRINDDLAVVLERMAQRLEAACRRQPCLNCPEPDFACGLGSQE